MQIATQTNFRKCLVKGWRLKAGIHFARRQQQDAEYSAAPGVEPCEI
jgi:hypothetical protein